MRHNRKGMTLVEVIVTLAIFSVLMGVAASLILSGGDAFARGAQLDTDKYIGDAVFGFVENRVKYATHLTVAKAQGAGSSDALYVEDGRFMYRRGAAQAYDVYGGDFYSGRTVGLRMYRGDDGGYILEALVYRSGQSEPAYTARASVELVNASLPGSSVTLSWTEADAAAAPSCALVFDSYELMAGAYADRTVNELSIRAEILSGQYALLRTLYAQTGADKQAVLARMQRLFESGGVTLSGTVPTSADYARAVQALCDGGKWPSLPMTAVPELASLNASIYASVSGAVVRPLYFTADDGTVGTALYYAAKSGAPNGALLLYSTRTDAWYAYTARGASGNYLTYDMSTLRGAAAAGALLDAAERQQNWLKIS
ncbi:MAG: prepilin-type N-terminal cleavage/methylation domain-containing protein [Oscillospiraceae bacterium]|nr:prepilin-type N-terminal cleavage/methylation domain-containing protein [Oscillospiraceae bacterium]